MLYLVAYEYGKSNFYEKLVENSALSVINDAISKIITEQARRLFYKKKYDVKVSNSAIHFKYRMKLHEACYNVASCCVSCSEYSIPTIFLNLIFFLDFSLFNPPLYKSNIIISKK